MTDDAAYVAKAPEAAANGHLVSAPELVNLSARIHVSRSGQLAPEGDETAPDSERKQGLEQSVRDRAYLLWEQAGRPEGRADEFGIGLLMSTCRSGLHAVGSSGTPRRRGRPVLAPNRQLPIAMNCGAPASARLPGCVCQSWRESSCNEPPFHRYSPRRDVPSPSGWLPPCPPA